MRKIISTALVAVCFSAPLMAEDTLSENDKLSYSFGRSIGYNLQAQESTNINMDMLLKGISETLNPPEKPVLSDEQVKATLTAFQQARLEKKQAAEKVKQEENLKAAEAFLAENRKQEGVKELPSGLQYKIISEGTGKSPALEDSVTVHYRGTLADGTEFDSSHKRNEPTSFRVNQVIAGWTQALQMMKEGGKWELVIPPKLAYGERGAPPVIPANAALKFEVELLKIGEEEAPKAEEAK